MKLSNSWSLSEAMEVGVFVALPLVVFLEGPADPWVVIGTGFVFDTVEDMGADDPHDGARLQNRLLSPIWCQYSLWGT